MLAPMTTNPLLDLHAEVRAAARDVELLNVVEERCPDGEERK